jgi:hypothetical protein
MQSNERKSGILGHAELTGPNWVSYSQIRVASGQPVLRNEGWKQKIPDIQKWITRNFRRQIFSEVRL